MDLKGWTSEGTRHKRKLILRKSHFFVIEKYIEDANQDEKHVPDLLQSIIQPPGLVKEDLWPKLFKMNNFESKIKKIRVCTFQMSGKNPDSANVAFEGVISTHPIHFNPAPPPFCDIWPH